MGKKKPIVKVKRDWSLAEKLAIVTESYEDGAVGVDVAARHSLTSSRLYGWRTELKEGRIVACQANIRPRFPSGFISQAP